MHDVAVAREQRCRVGVFVAQVHEVGPMMIVIARAAYVRSPDVNRQPLQQCSDSLSRSTRRCSLA